MTSSVHSYQMMVDKQTQQLKAVSMEKDRLKRDLDSNGLSLRELKETLDKLDTDCKDTSSKLESRLNKLQMDYNTLSATKIKLETKYKTLSKSNADAISDIERLNTDNKKLRGDVQEAESTKAEQLNKLRDTLAQTLSERDRYKEQYNSLYKDYQQFADDHVNIKNDRDRLQQQIHQIQKLSGINNPDGSSSPAPVMDEPKVMQKPAQAFISSSSSPLPQELQGAEPVGVASKAPPPASKVAPLVPAPPLAGLSKPTPSSIPKVDNDVFPVPAAQLPLADNGFGDNDTAFRGARNIENGGLDTLGARSRFLQPYVNKIDPIKPQQPYGQRYVIHDDHFHPVQEIPQSADQFQDGGHELTADNADFSADGGENQLLDESAVGAADYNEIQEEREVDSLQAPRHHNDIDPVHHIPLRHYEAAQQQHHPAAYQVHPQVHPALQQQFGVHLPNNQYGGQQQQRAAAALGGSVYQPYQQQQAAQPHKYGGYRPQNQLLQWPQHQQQQLVQAAQNVRSNVRRDF